MKQTNEGVTQPFPTSPWGSTAGDCALLERLLPSFSFVVTPSQIAAVFLPCVIDSQLTAVLRGVTAPTQLGGLGLGYQHQCVAMEVRPIAVDTVACHCAPVCGPPLTQPTGQC